MQILEFANDILIDPKGYKAYLTDEKLYIRDPQDTSNPLGYLLTNESDLGEPGIDKLVNYLHFDYVGTFDISFYIGENRLATLTAPLTSTRRVGQLYMPLTTRKPFQKLMILIRTTHIGSEMYGMELDFSVMKKRYNG